VWHIFTVYASGALLPQTCIYGNVGLHILEDMPMSRLTIDLTDEQHRHLKAVAALEGKTIRQFATERLFPAATDAALSDEDQAWEEFKLFIGKRVDDALESEPIKLSVTDVFNQVLALDEAA
jgi:Antitoxin ParD